jgi:hypothetical protein
MRQQARDFKIVLTSCSIYRTVQAFHQDQNNHHVFKVQHMLVVCAVMLCLCISYALLSARCIFYMKFLVTDLENLESKSLAFITNSL